MDVNYNIYNDVRTTWKNKYLSCRNKFNIKIFIINMSDKIKL